MTFFVMYYVIFDILRLESILIMTNYLAGKLGLDIEEVYPKYEIFRCEGWLFKLDLLTLPLFLNSYYYESLPLSSKDGKSSFHSTFMRHCFLIVTLKSYEYLEHPIVCNVIRTPFSRMVPFILKGM